MQNMENVCEIANQTEQGSKVVKEEKVGSADLGKFKDVSALLQAYQALQAEFTRRSQRLKRLEEQDKQRRNGKELGERAPITDAENVRAEKPVASDADVQIASNADGQVASDADVQFASLKNAVSASQPSDEVQVAAETARNTVASEADAPCDGGECPCSTKEEKITAMHEADLAAAHAKISGVENNSANVEREIQAERVVEQSAQSLYEQAAANEEVRLRIVGDYLSSIGKSNAPLIKGGVGALVAPPKKPRNISDAGNMALAYLKASKEQA